MRMTRLEQENFDHMLSQHASQETSRLIKQLTAAISTDDRAKIELFMRVVMWDTLTLLDSAVGKAVQP